MLRKRRALTRDLVLRSSLEKAAAALVAEGRVRRMGAAMSAAANEMPCAVLVWTQIVRDVVKWREC